MRILKNLTMCTSLFAAVGMLSVQASALDFKFSDKGIEINGGAMGNFELSYPKISLRGGGDKPKDPIEKKVNGGKAVLKYEGGIQADLEKSGDNLSITFSNPGDLEKYRMEMMIPFNFNDGGKWKVGDKEGEFPKEKPPKPQFYQGNANSVQITSDTGQVMSFKVPEYTYHQLQDNREWNWKIFVWIMFANFNNDNPKSEFTIKGGAAAPSIPGQKDTSILKVDKFGQAFKKDFPDKVKSEEELKKDVETEKAYYDSLKVPAMDALGGFPGSGEKLGLKKTGFFHVEKKGEKWFLADPEGNAFFHLGICSFGAGGEDSTYIEGRENIYEWLPPHDGSFGSAWHPDKWWNPRAVSFYKANVVRKYGEAFNDDVNTKRLIERVKKFGFNSVGAFSGSAGVAKQEKFPYVAHLPLYLGEVPGIRGVFDPFDEGLLKKMDESFSKSIPGSADEPLVIGYFLANEQGWEDLPRAVPALPGKHPCKLKLVEMLKNKYKDIAAFNTAWGMTVASFDDLKEQGLPLKTKASFEDMQTYNELFLEAYYKAIVDTFRKYDKNHMLIGNRWQPGTANSEVLCRVAGKYMDIISINYYTSGIDAAFIRRLYEWTGKKPQMWSEFYFTAEKESNAGAGNDVISQKERGEAYRYYVEGAAALGFVVGIEWFTMLDQAVTGRFFEKQNGERANTGIFNVADRPYKNCVAEMMKTNYGIYDVVLNGKAPYIYDNPRFSVKAKASRDVQAGKALGPMKIDCQIENWPGRPPTMISGERLVIGRENFGVEAAFKACWDDKNLYLLVNITDPTPMKNEQKDDSLWNSDGIEIFIGGEKLDQAGPLLFTDRQILIGGGKSGQFCVVNASTQPQIETAVAPSVDGKGYTIEAAIPWSALDIKPKEGMELLFDIGVDDSADGKGRRCQLMWNGIARNSSDRGAWGRLKLVP
ncbi:MAG: hypothetical protein A2X48_18900 [Lentisphaerae bacterium GWF2_49_21]|nr:MAG: hypothetical protein A2X48_18900 [Lentisphaerae bacterium GWF2_49_21]